jgi:hypothetical protein
VKQKARSAAIFGFVLAVVAAVVNAAPVRIRIADRAAPRVEHGVERLQAALLATGAEVRVMRGNFSEPADILAGSISDEGIRSHVSSAPRGKPGREGFVLSGGAGRPLVIAGADDSGTLYGCLELAQRIRAQGSLPREPLQIVDQPQFVLRGPCIGMQKTYILPGRHVYEYPYTRELFPFFYDRAFWREYLDFLAEHRFNTLYLWNGHPFASLVRLPDYPNAIEVDEAQFRENVAMYHYITAECERRGIWLVQMFYNVFLPKPLAEKHGVATQLSKSTPLAADYTRKVIAEFVKQYPNVGLMPTLGEALQGTSHQIEWATKTILPGVLDGMKAAGLKEQPPVVFRTHAMDPVAIMPEAFRIYQNLFTETKYNGESLTTWEPRGKSQATHLAMAKLGPHLANVHVLANLEPFRYGATEFIRKSMLASRDRLGATGLHLYPLAYWSWPDTPDATTPALKQWHRDWIWFEAWARYAWNPEREPAADRIYWVGRLAEHFGSTEAAGLILDAYNHAGECAPRIIRRFGITEGNRQTMALGMTLDQLVNPEKYGLFHDLYESQSPPGERLQDFVENEVKGAPHVGETPEQIAREVLEFSQRAFAALEAASSHVTRNRDEFARLRNDAACIRAMSANYAAKARAAYHVLRFRHTKDVADMVKARALLAESLEHFRMLARLTRETYRFANTMQTSQRRIPFVGAVDGKPANYHWTQLLPLYEKELAEFDTQLAAIRQGGAAAAKALARAAVQPVRFSVHSADPRVESFTLRAGARVFYDAPFEIQELATELEGVRGIRFSHEAAKSGRHGPLEFSTDIPVRVLIGYVRSDSAEWRKAPRSEFDAAAAERGGTEPLMLAAAKISGLPPIDVYELSFAAGRHKIEPPGSGSFLVLGIVAATEP